MGKTERVEPRERKRRRLLNVVYFVDSSRTRSFTMPVSRLTLLVAAAALVTVWAAGATGLVVWLVGGQEDLRARLRKTLHTVFEFETRYEDVFGIAYPQEKNTPESPPPSVAALYQEEAEAAAPPDSGMPAGPAGAAKADASGPEDKLAANKTGSPSTPAVTPAPAAASAAPAAPGGAPAAAQAMAVVVGNPVIEKGQDSLLLHFDLTNKGVAEKAEGYVWAVAEFVTDKGERLFVGAPADVAVSGTGEASNPERSAIFSIRRYKKKSLSFPFFKGRVGTFQSVRIGLMDRGTQGRTFYNVPVNIKVGAGVQAPAENGAMTAPPKSG